MSRIPVQLKHVRMFEVILMIHVIISLNILLLAVHTFHIRDLTSHCADQTGILASKVLLCLFLLTMHDWQRQSVMIQKIQNELEKKVLIM